MTVYKLLTPPDEEAEVYPYRNVWRSLIIENTLLFAVTLAAFVAFFIFRVQLPGLVQLMSNGLLVALPVILWLVFSVLRERSVPQPRSRLIAVFLITGLVANALAIPFIEEVLQPERWLPLGGAINRIIGYTFTVGIVQEVAKYAVVRFIVWPDYFRTRLDSVAYCVASALGYALVMNLRYLIAESDVSPDVMAVEVFANVAVNVAASLVVSYGLSEVHFGKPTPFLMTITVAFAALLNGMVIPLRSGLVNAAFVLQSSEAEASIISTIIGLFSSQTPTPKPVLGFGFSTLILIAFGFIIAFLFNNAERQAREAARSED